MKDFSYMNIEQLDDDTFVSPNEFFKSQEPACEAIRWYAYDDNIIHSPSPAILEVDNKVFSIDNAFMCKPQTVKLPTILEYMGLSIDNLDTDTNKFKLDNNQKRPLKKIDPFDKINTILNTEGHQLFATITSSKYAKANRMTSIPLHTKTTYKRDANIKEHGANYKMQFSKWLGGFNFDGLLIISKDIDFSKVDQYILTAQIKTIFPNPHPALGTEEERKVFKNDKFRINLRKECKTILINDILGKSYTKGDIKQEVRYIVEQMYTLCEREIITYLKTPKNMWVLNCGYIKKNEDINGAA